MAWTSVMMPLARRSPGTRGGGCGLAFATAAFGTTTARVCFTFGQPHMHSPKEAAFTLSLKFSQAALEEGSSEEGSHARCAASLAASAGSMRTPAAE